MWGSCQTKHYFPQSFNAAMKPFQRFETPIYRTKSGGLDDMSPVNFMKQKINELSLLGLQQWHLLIGGTSNIRNHLFEEIIKFSLKHQGSHMWSDPGS